jgi:DNA-binding protein HU-beta
VNKAQLVDHLSDRFGGKRQASEALDYVLDAIQRTVTAGEKVVITGFGVFEKVDRPARTARNPATGERVKVKKTSVPKFRPGSDFKSFVSGAKKLPKAAAGAAKKATSAVTDATTGGAAAAKKTAGTTKTAAARKTTATKTSAAKTTATRSTAAKKTTATKKAAPAKKATATKKTAATKKASPATKSTAKKTTASSSTTARMRAAKKT